MPKKITKGKNETSIIGSSRVLMDTINLAKRVAQNDHSVFIYGESGVGKGVLARFIQKNSLRSDKPFITISCPDLPENMLEDELFGHEKGAFTGAIAKRTGKFEAAHGGTLFLDEIGDLPITAQAKLLRVLQDKELERLGGNQTVRVDVRVMAATNMDIPKMIAEGKFREDLFYRLQVISIEIPPLRNRLEDVPELAEYILGKNSNQGQYFHPKTLKMLKQRQYCRNNIRELEGIIISAIVQAGQDPCIKPEHFNFQHSFKERSDKFTEDNNLNIAQNIAPLMNALVQKSMAKHNGVKTKAANELGVSVFQLEKLLITPDISSQECLQCIQPNKKVEKKDRTANLPQEGYHEQQLLEQLDPRAKTVMEIAKRNGGVTNNMIQDNLRISRSSAKRLLSSLVNIKLLHKEGNGRGSHYVLAAR